jgi:hypothetical protein
LVAERQAGSRPISRCSAERGEPGLFISDRIPLEDYAGALDRFKRGIGRKIQVIP